MYNINQYMAFPSPVCVIKLFFVGEIDLYGSVSIKEEMVFLFRKASSREFSVFDFELIIVY